MGTSKALDVIEFEPASFGASVALLVHKGAPASVAFEDDALDRVRDVVRIRRPSHCGGGLPRLPADGEALLLACEHGLRAASRAGAAGAELIRDVYRRHLEMA